MSSFLSHPRPTPESPSARLPVPTVPFATLLVSDVVVQHLASFLSSSAVLATAATSSCYLAPFRRQITDISLLHELSKGPADSKLAAGTLTALLRSASPSLRSISYKGRTDVLILALEGVVLPHVEGLALRHNGLMEAGAALLINTLRERCLPSLKALDLRDNMLGDTGAAAVAAGLRDGGGLELLHELKLDGNQLESSGAAALADVMRDPSAAEALTRLTLASNGIAEEGVGDLATAFRSGCRALTSLDLSDNPIAAEGAEALGKSLRAGGLPGLLELRVSNCEIGPGGAQHLSFALQHGGCPSLERLYMNECYIGTGGAQALAASLAAGACSRLTCLDVTGNGIKAVALPGLMAALALAPRGTGMRELRLSGNPLAMSEEAAVKELANALRGGWGLPRLEVLDVAGTGLTSAGLKLLAAALITPGTGPCLTELHLSDNSLTPEDVKLLAGVLQSRSACPRLTRLAVRGTSGASAATKGELLGKVRVGLSVDIA